MIRGCVTWIFVLTFFAVVLDRIVAETLILKNGSAIKGSIVQMNETDVTVETADMGQVIIKRRTIQSIEDKPTAEVAGSNASQGVLPANPAPVGVNINNNNNINDNLQNDNQPTSEAKTVAGNSTQSQPINTMTASGESQDTSAVLGHLALGLNWLKIGADDFYKPTPVVHWDIIGYRADNGFTTQLFVQGTRQSETRAGITQWLHGGLRFGWSSTPPAYGSAGKLIQVGLTVGRMGLRTEKNGKEFYDDAYDYEVYPIYAQLSRRTSLADDVVRKSEYHGNAYGLSLGYSYFGRRGLGLQVGIDGFYGVLERKKTEEKPFYYYRDAVEEDKSKIQPVSYSSYAGLAYIF